MKRIFSTVCLIALVALVATSCKKKTDEVSSLHFTLEEVKGFEADDDTKGYIDIDDLQMKWNEGDCIMVYNIDDDDYLQSVAEEWVADEGSEGKIGTQFHGVAVGEMIDMYYFFYPASKASGNLQQGNRETFTVEQHQTYNEKLGSNGKPMRFDPNSLVLACLVDGPLYQHSYTLNHIFGFLNVKLKGNLTGKYVEKVEVTDNMWNLWGTMSLNISQSISPATFNEYMQNLIDSNGTGDAYETYLANMSSYLQSIGYIAQGVGKTIILDCGHANGGNGVAAETKNFFIALRPGALYKGFTVKVTFKGGATATKVVNEAEAMSKLIKPGTFSNVSVQVL